MAGAGAGYGLLEISDGHYEQGGFDLLTAGLGAKALRKYGGGSGSPGRRLNDLLGVSRPRQRTSLSDGCEFAGVGVRAYRPPVPKGYTRVYRAVSEGEYQQILRDGKFKLDPKSAEGKYFADTLRGAREHGESLFEGAPFRIIEVDVPDNAPSLYRWANLDNKGPARFFHIDDLGNIWLFPPESN
jgi:hypothetical protein